MRKGAILVLAIGLLALAAAGALAAEKAAKPPVAFDSPQSPGVQATCPVTGETFTIAKDTASSQYKGKYYYFCCPSCKPDFDKDPEKFLKKTN
jgi:YHS domain-containing protein